MIPIATNAFIAATCRETPIPVAAIRVTRPICSICLARRILGTFVYLGSKGIRTEYKTAGLRGRLTSIRSGY